MTNLLALSRWLRLLTALVLVGAALPACSADPASTTTPSTPFAGQSGMAGSPEETATSGSGGSAGVTGTDSAEPADGGIVDAGGEMLTIEEQCAALDQELGVARPAGWAVDSHCKEAKPDYD